MIDIVYQVGSTSSNKVFKTHLFMTQEKNMQLLNEFNWDLTDFVVMGGLLFGLGSLFVLGVRMVSKPMHRMIMGVILLGLFFRIWAESAVGVFTNWGS